MKRIALCILSVLLLLTLAMPVFAHPGRTDSSGGHTKKEIHLVEKTIAAEECPTKQSVTHMSQCFKLRMEKIEKFN